MPSKRTGGRSLRYTISIPVELDKAIRKKMKSEGITVDADAVRTALAAWVGQPALAEGVQRGRKWPEDPKKRTYRTK